MATAADGHRAVGSDFDVHLHHSLADGVFFDHRYDCYWNDWDYGSAFATLRVYLWGELADEWSSDFGVPPSP